MTLRIIIGSELSDSSDYCRGINDSSDYCRGINDTLDYCRDAKNIYFWLGFPTKVHWHGFPTIIHRFLKSVIYAFMGFNYVESYFFTRTIFY